MSLLTVPCMLVEIEGVLEQFPLIKHCYFKHPYGTQAKFASGLVMPEPGIYFFKNCTFHPGLADYLDQYAGSQFYDCEMP